MAGITFSEGSGVADSFFGKSQAPIKAIIADRVESFQEQSMIDKVFYMDTTSNYAEKYTSATALGDFQDVGENGAYPLTSVQEGYSKIIEPTTWKSRFEVTMEMMEDAKFNVAESKARKFAGAYNRTREKYAAELIAGGVGTSVTFGGKKYDTTSADGVSLFSNAHGSATKGYKNQSNRFKYTAGTDKYTEILDAAQEQMQDIRDDDGNLLNIKPDTIIIPNSGKLKRALFAAIGSELDPNTNNNAFNFQIGLWNVLVWNYLPKTIGGKEYFMLLDSDYNKDAMCMPWLDRVSLKVRSTVDDNSDANYWSGRARFGAGFNDWRAISIVGDAMTNGTALL